MAQAPSRTLDAPVPEAVGEIVCLRGILELSGAPCVSEIDNCAALSSFSAEGLVAYRRAEGRIQLAGHEVELRGQLCVTFGSLESADGRKAGGLLLRALRHGDRVRARGRLLRSEGGAAASYRQATAGWALEGVGPWGSLEVACDGETYLMAEDVGSALIGEVALTLSHADRGHATGYLLDRRRKRQR